MRYGGTLSTARDGVSLGGREILGSQRRCPLKNESIHRALEQRLYQSEAEDLVVYKSTCFPSTEPAKFDF